MPQALLDGPVVVAVFGEVEGQRNAGEERATRILGLLKHAAICSVVTPTCVARHTRRELQVVAERGVLLWHGLTQAFTDLGVLPLHRLGDRRKCLGKSGQEVGVGDDLGLQVLP